MYISSCSYFDELYEFWNIRTPIIIGYNSKNNEL